MVIRGKAHCFFEQSGTFKREFVKLGVPAEDYDIQNHFGETDHVVDLFAEIEKAYGGGKSVFDTIGKDDLIMAFFPCIEFSAIAQVWFSLGAQDYRTWETRRIFQYMLHKNDSRSTLFSLLYKFVCVCLERNIRMIFENPWGLNTYLKQNTFLKNPDIIDNDRSRRGDFRIKPTAYWFWNCVPTHGETYQPYQGKIQRHVEMKKSPKAGQCSEERSMISPDYARNFICDFILGKEQPELEKQMVFDFMKADKS